MLPRVVLSRKRSKFQAPSPGKSLPLPLAGPGRVRQERSTHQAGASQSFLASPFCPSFQGLTPYRDHESRLAKQPTLPESKTWGKILAAIRNKMENVILSISPKKLSHQLSIGCSCCQGSLGTGAASQSHQFLRIPSPVCVSF